MLKIYKNNFILPLTLLSRFDPPSKMKSLLIMGLGMDLPLRDEKSIFTKKVIGPLLSRQTGRFEAQLPWLGPLWSDSRPVSTLSFQVEIESHE